MLVSLNFLKYFIGIQLTAPNDVLQTRIQILIMSSRKFENTNTNWKQKVLHYNSPLYLIWAAADRWPVYGSDWDGHYVALANMAHGPLQVWPGMKSTSSLRLAGAGERIKDLWSINQPNLNFTISN